jgi:alpha-1,3-mannosyltransferase
LVFFRSVNFKFIPEKLFISKEFAVALLILHLTTLVVFAHYKWLRWVFLLGLISSKDWYSFTLLLYNHPVLPVLDIFLALVVRHEAGLIGFMHSRFKSLKSIQQLLSYKPGPSDLSKERMSKPNTTQISYVIWIYCFFYCWSNLMVTWIQTL